MQKIHPVKGSRDPTKHTYTLNATRYQQTTMDILEDIRLVIDCVTQSYITLARAFTFSPTCIYEMFSDILTTKYYDDMQLIHGLGTVFLHPFQLSAL